MTTKVRSSATILLFTPKLTSPAGREQSPDSPHSPADVVDRQQWLKDEANRTLEPELVRMIESWRTKLAEPPPAPPR